MDSNLLTSFNSPLGELQAEQLSKLLMELNPIQKAWMSGYLAAQAQASFLNNQGAFPVANSSATLLAPNKSIVILYGSQTGNAKTVATQLHEQLQQAKVTAELQNMDQFKTNQLKTVDYLLIVVSTNGEGEPPDDALQLHTFLKGTRAAQLFKDRTSPLKFSIAALGDSSYQYFCKTGHDFSEFLTKLGAQQLLDTASFDVDYKKELPQWFDQLSSSLSQELNQQIQSIPEQSNANKLSNGTVYDKDNPFAATVLLHQKITARHSVKEIYHLELDLGDSGITYQAGDVLGVWFKNDPILIEQLIELWELDGSSTIQDISIRQLLTERYELTQAYPTFVKAYAPLTKHPDLIKICQNDEQLFEYSKTHHIIDVVRQYPLKLNNEDLEKLLRPISPRYYSIASSQAEVGNEIHLTVSKVVYDTSGQEYKGGASCFLTERVQENDLLNIYIIENKHFRLPADDKPVIMFGSGTGVAPFRAFLQERDNRDTKGKNWLFFGNTHFTQDFLYQTEMQSYLSSGLLSKIDLAFSRDQAEKVYLQHRIIEEGVELYQWLEQGASLYVCGALTMSKGVEQSLLQIIAEQGKLSESQAADYLEQLRSDKRYLKDVY